MELLNLSIRELNNLFINKKAKPSELYSEIFDRSANSEAALHAHLSLFEETNLNFLFCSIILMQLNFRRQLRFALAWLILFYFFSFQSSVFLV